MVTAGRTALCLIAEDGLFNRVRRAILAAGLLPIRAAGHDVRTAGGQPHVAVMIYDAEGRDLETMIDTVRQWRRVYPGRPILLYHPATPAASTLVGRLTPLPGVSARARVPGLSSEEQQLTNLLKALAVWGPELVVRGVIGAMRRIMPVPVEAFVDALANRLETGGTNAPQVSKVAKGAGLTAWAVSRACRKARLPTPEHLIQWLTLIYVIALAEWEHLSIAQAAARVGVADRYVRKLRASLLPDVGRLTGTVAPEVLPDAIMRFARACGFTRDEAAVLAERLIA